MICYKKNILQALKEVGYTTYRLQKEKILASGTVQKLREGDTSLSMENINTLCRVLACQPGDLIEWAPDAEE